MKSEKPITSCEYSGSEAFIYTNKSGIEKLIQTLIDLKDKDSIILKNKEDLSHLSSDIFKDSHPDMYVSKIKMIKINKDSETICFIRSKESVFIYMDLGGIEEFIIFLRHLKNSEDTSCHLTLYNELTTLKEESISMPEGFSDIVHVKIINLDKIG